MIEINILPRKKFKFCTETNNKKERKKAWHFKGEKRRRKKGNIITSVFIYMYVYQFLSELNCSFLVAGFLPWTAATKDTNPLEPWFCRSFHIFLVDLVCFFFAWFFLFVYVCLVKECVDFFPWTREGYKEREREGWEWKLSEDLLMNL